MVDSQSAIGIEPPVAAEARGPAISTPRGARRVVLWGALGLLALLIAWGTYRATVMWYVRQLADRCHEAWRTGQFAELEKMAREWVRWDRSQAQPFLYLADAAQKRGDYRAAVRWLDQLPRRDPKTVPALVEQTTLLFGPLNDPLEGERACLRVLELEPAAVEPRQRLIFYYAQTLQRHKMINQIREAIRVGSDTREDYVYLIGAYYLVFSNGAEQNHHWLKNCPDNEHFLVARALHLIGSGIVGDEAKDDPEPKRVYDFQRQQMVKEHEAVLLDYMRRFPQNLELLNYFLWQAMTNGEIQRVAKLLQQVPDTAVDDGRFWRYKGWLLSAQKKFREAEQAYRKALECHPFDYPSHHQLAQVLRHLGRESEVSYIQNLGERGNELRRELLQLPNARAVTDEQLLRIAAYIEDCGDQQVADALKRRLHQAAGLAPDAPSR